MAVFCETGRQPSRSEAFTIAVTYVSSTSSESFRRKVGMGYSVHDLVGDDMMARCTSSSEQVTLHALLQWCVYSHHSCHTFTLCLCSVTIILRLIFTNVKPINIVYRNFQCCVLFTNFKTLCYSKHIHLLIINCYSQDAV